MKAIEQKKLGEFETAKLMKQVCETSINGMNLTQMRSRIRVLDAIDATKDGADILMEDADYSTLTEAINGMPWALASRDLLAVIDGILNARKADKVKKAA
jgi:hypothetical protein